MKAFSCVKSLMLFTLLIGFVSCNEYYTDDFLRNSDEKLCGKVWVEEYETIYGGLGLHKLEFTINGKGKETIEYQLPTSDGKWIDRKESSGFTWYWVDELEGLRMDFGANEVYFFDNVWVREYYLSGKFRGEEVTFYLE